MKAEHICYRIPQLQKGAKKKNIPLSMRPADIFVVFNLSFYFSCVWIFIMKLEFLNIFIFTVCFFLLMYYFYMCVFSITYFFENNNSCIITSKSCTTSLFNHSHVFEPGLYCFHVYKELAVGQQMVEGWSWEERNPLKLDVTCSGEPIRYLVSFCVSGPVMGSEMQMWILIGDQIWWVKVWIKVIVEMGIQKIGRIPRGM